LRNGYPNLARISINWHTKKSKQADANARTHTRAIRTYGACSEVSEAPCPGAGRGRERRWVDDVVT
jgi:hypothetical protein